MKEKEANDVSENEAKVDLEQEEGNLSELEEALEDVPEEVRHEVKNMMMSMHMGRITSPEMKLMDKLTPEHVSEFLAGEREASNNQFKESRDNKIFLGITLVVVLVFIVILVIILKDKPDILEKVLFTLGGLVTGLLGGYGFGKYKGSE